MIAIPLLIGVVVLWLARRPLARALIRWRLGPYRITVNTVDAKAPLKLSQPRKVAVIGGGLAGIAAASTLGPRGYAVTLFEANSYLGGKLGSWQVELAPGKTEWVSHGFHAFFRHYYNLDRFLLALGARQKFKPISDYRILLPGGEEVSFGELENTPVLNLLSLAKQGVYRMSEVMAAPTRDLMGVFLEYDPVTTFARLDGMSFAEFDRRARLPRQLKLAFNTFSRAFFADEERLSMAELVKGFHSYYLGHDGGLVYDYPVQDYEASILAPVRAHFAANSVRLELSSPVSSLSRDGEGFTVNGERFDAVVMACDVVGTRAVLSTASGLEGLDQRLLSLAPGQRYAANRVLARDGLREEPVESIPLRGLLAGIPQSPARKRLMGAP